MAGDDWVFVEREVSIAEIVEKYLPNLKPYESLYKHFHKNPELSWLEKETSERIVSELRKLKYHVVDHIGGYGLCGILENGKGPTVLLRADMDALPIEELTGLPYASTRRMKDSDGEEQPVMHACGHDIHITSLLGAAETMYKAREHWSGTLICLFQPAEEKEGGAQAMVDDGLYSKHKVPVPDVCLGAHVMPIRSGNVATHAGPFLLACDSFKVTINGKGSHASQPQLAIDPISIAAHTIVRLQSLIARELGILQQGILTVGAVHGGSAENIIPSSAYFKIDIRTMDEKIRKKVVSRAKQIINAEAAVNNVPKPPTLKNLSSYPTTVNDKEVTHNVAQAFGEIFGKNHYDLGEPLQGSEDFSNLARAKNIPYCYWTYGGIDQDLWDRMAREGRTDEIPANHSAYFKPVIEPTIKTGMSTYISAALAFLKM